MRTFALVLGLIFALIGIAGFIPGLLAPPDRPGELMFDGGHGLLFGLFPVNWLHNLVHLAFGVWGLAASRGWGSSRAYARSVAIIYGVLTVMGFIPGLHTTFGLVPLYGNAIWLHGLITVAAAYFGWVARVPADRMADTTVRT